MTYFRKGEHIPLTNASFCQVYKGVIQINLPSNNQQDSIVVGWIAPNSFFGITNNCSSVHRLTAITDVYLQFYNAEDISRNPKLAKQLISELSNHILKIEQMIAVNSIKKIEDRLKELLQLLKKEVGHPVETGIRLTARFTHQNLADAVGTTRVTVTRILGNWQNLNLIEFDEERHLIIKF